MIKIRRGVFETNSSSTHSLTMCNDDVYDKWMSGELYWCSWDQTFASKKDILAEYIASSDLDKALAVMLLHCDTSDVDKNVLQDAMDDFDDFCADNGYYTFDRYFSCSFDYYDGNCAIIRPTGIEFGCAKYDRSSR